MVLTRQILRRLSVLFLGLSAALWVAKLSTRDDELEVWCRSNGSLSVGGNRPRGVDQLERGKLISTNLWYS